MAIKIEVDTLEIAFKRIISRLRNFEQVDEVEFDFDTYWQVSEFWEEYPEKYSMMVGSIVDDIDCIKMLVEDDERMCTYVDFDRVASILHAISETRNPV